MRQLNLAVGNTCLGEILDGAKAVHRIERLNLRAEYWIRWTARATDDAEKRYAAKRHLRTFRAALRIETDECWSAEIAAYQEAYPVKRRNVQWRDLLYEEETALCEQMLHTMRARLPKTWAAWESRWEGK